MPSLVFLFHVKVLNISLPHSPITNKNVEYCCSSVFPDIAASKCNCIVCFHVLHVAAKIPESKFISVGFGSRCSILISLIQSNFDDFFHSLLVPCIISSQDLSKFTYLTLDKYISDEKCVKVTSYIASINSLA